MLGVLPKSQGIAHKRRPRKMQGIKKRGCVISLWRTLFYVIYCIILEVS